MEAGGQMCIQQPATDYSALGLRLTDAVAVLEPLMPRVRRFNATATAGFDPGVRDAWGTYDQEAYCYGFGASCFLKLDVDGNFVKRIWFECRTQDVGNINALRKAMLAINALVPSAIADYWNDMVGAIQDSAFLDQYFQELTRPH